MKKLIGLMAIGLMGCGFHAGLRGNGRGSRHSLRMQDNSIVDDTTVKRCAAETKQCLQINLEDDGEANDSWDSEDGALCSTDSDCASKYGSN